jgi:hypothetical protein
MFLLELIVLELAHIKPSKRIVKVDSGKRQAIVYLFSELRQAQGLPQHINFIQSA